jgi:hypothetical protein
MLTGPDRESLAGAQLPMRTILYFLALLLTTLAFLSGCATELAQQEQMPFLAKETASPAARATVAPAKASVPAATPTALPVPAASATLAPATIVPEPTPTWLPEVMTAALPGTSQGFELVGHTALGEIGWHAAVTLYEHCAYVGNRRSDRAAIVDIGDPATPRQIGSLSFGAGAQPIELRVLPEHGVLVAADLGNGRLLTFDVSDCAAPAPLGALDLPGAPHEFFLWSDGDRALVFSAMFDAAPPDLIVVDITEPAQPVIVAEWSLEEEGIGGLLHALSLAPDGRRAHLALWNGGVLVAEIDLPQIRLLRDGSGAVRPALFVAAHSAVPLGDSRYLLVTSELWRCPFGEATIVNIADPARPYVVASLALPENRCDDLPAEDAVFSAHNPLVVGDLVFASWYSAGVQVFDVSDPLQPERVAQFVPAGDGAAPLSHLGSHPVQTWSYPVLYQGLLYVVDIQSGLYILRYHGPGAESVAATERAEENVTVSP